MIVKLPAAIVYRRMQISGKMKQTPNGTEKR